MQTLESLAIAIGFNQLLIYKIPTMDTNQISPTNQGEVVIITGGTSGIGKEAVKYFHNHGFKVATFGSSEHKINQLRTEFKDKKNILIEQIDIENKEAILDFILKTQRTLGDISILINNAATLGPT